MDGKLPAPTSPPVRKSQATQLVLGISPSKPSGPQGPMHPHLISATIVENLGILSGSARRLSRTNRHGRGSIAKQRGQSKRPIPQVKQGKHNFTCIHLYLRTPSPKVVV
jgi:hypothetical protein